MKSQRFDFFPLLWFVYNAASEVLIVGGSCMN